MKNRKFSELVLLSTTIKDGNMPFITGDKGGLKNRKRFLELSNLKFEDLVVLALQHKSKVYIATEKDLGRGAKSLKIAIRADALITNKRNLYLSLLTADCLPIAVYDPKNNVVALIHGSRHNIEGIIKNTIEKMIKHFKTDPKDLVVNIGPSIGPCHYEIDLWIIAEDELISLGIKKKNIYNPRICTFESKDYYSYRKSKKENISDNRFATIFGMK